MHLCIVILKQSYDDNTKQITIQFNRNIQKKSQTKHKGSGN